jgi:NRPS condensation-like uncharacterized protein
VTTGQLEEIETRYPALEDLLPLSPLQQGLLFETFYQGEGSTYAVQICARLEGAVEARTLRAAWQQVLDRHSALRSAFLLEADRPLQVVCGDVALPFDVLDWRDLPQDGQEEKLAAWLAADRAAGFDTARAPLLRVTLLRLADTRQAMVFTVHHALLDGWSMPVLFTDLLASYGARAAGRVPELPPARPYRDYIAWLERRDRAGAEVF